MKTQVQQHDLFLFAGIIGFLFAGIGFTRAQTLGEALDATNLVWTTGGDAVWFAETTNTYDGIDAVQSGSVQSNQTSWLETTVVGPATISFWVSNHWNQSIFPYFFWYFNINGISPNPGFAYPMGSQWNEQIYDLGEGTHVLRWTAVGTGAGCESGYVCVDEFTVSPPRPLAILYQPMDSTVYSGEPVFLMSQPSVLHHCNINGSKMERTF